MQKKWKLGFIVTGMFVVSNMIACSNDSSTGETNTTSDDVIVGDTGSDTVSDSGTGIGSDTDTGTGTAQDPSYDADSDGWSLLFDCDDENNAINPDALEAQNGIDDDCDGIVDELEIIDTDTTDVCASNDFSITPSPVALMILEDMSGSMTPDDTSDPNKWVQVRDALLLLLTDFSDSQIEFGLDMFPAVDLAAPGVSAKCTIRSAPLLDCAPDNADNIYDILYPLTDEQPAGSTPLWLGMDNYVNASYAPGCIGDNKQTYLLIISDGGDQCGILADGTGLNASATQLGNKAAELLSLGIKSLAIGFGTGVSVAQLKAIASNGGTEFTTYLLADNQAELTAAFQQIASSIVSCNFQVPSVSQDADRDAVNFYFGDEVVPFDDQCAADAGWMWVDAQKTEIQFCESKCADLQSGNIVVSATWGCPTVSID